GAILIAERRAEAVAVDNVVASANNGLAIGEWRPREINARTPTVSVCRKHVPFRMRRSSEINDPAFIGDLRVLLVEIEIGERIVALPEPAEQVVSQPDVQREAGRDAVVVLHVKTPVIVALIGSVIRAGAAAGIHRAEKKCGQAVATQTAYRIVGEVA